VILHNLTKAVQTVVIVVVWKEFNRARKGTIRAILSTSDSLRSSHLHVQVARRDVLKITIDLSPDPRGGAEPQ